MLDFGRKEAESCPRKDAIDGDFFIEGLCDPDANPQVTCSGSEVQFLCLPAKLELLLLTPDLGHFMEIQKDLVEIQRETCADLFCLLDRLYGSGIAMGQKERGWS